MTALTRRRFLAGAGGVMALSRLSIGAPSTARVGIVGGGFGGASLARYLRRHDANVSITLIERDATFVTCPCSNGVIAGLYPLTDVSFDYEAARPANITVLREEAVKLDPAR